MNLHQVVPMFVVVVAIMACFGIKFAVAEDAEPEQSTAVLETEEDRIGYTIGRQLGASVLESQIEMSVAGVLAGVEDVLRNRQSAMTDEQMQQTMMTLQMKMMQEMQSEASDNLEAANAFLEENAEQDGVVTLDSGLQYRIVEAGEGDSPAATDQVSVHYRGTLLSGEQFDSSYDRGQPATFGVNQVIPGWQEALQLMKPGAKWELFIPPDLAYGETGNQRIPGNSLLLFDVELLEVIDQ